MVSFQLQDDTLTYERHFGLSEKPFSLNADPRFIYDSPAYAATSAALLAGIRRREGLLVLTGEIGAGKTTLCRAVIHDLGRRTYSSLVPDPFASREDLLKMLLIDFGVLSIRDLTNGPLRGASRTELGYLLAEFLNALAPETFVVVIIDEAQNLSLPLIEEARILSDTFGARGRLQLLFVGQPELQGKLKLPEMRQVDQRVCGYHRLGTLNRDGVAGYIQHRLQAAGGHRDLFSPELVDTIHQRSGGVPRLINRVCDRALHLAFERQAQCVDRETLDAALAEVGSTTLLPTWDSIVFAESPTTPPAPPAAPTPAPPPASVAHAVESTPPIDHDEEFRSEIADWVEQDLAAPPRTPAPVSLGDDAPASRRRPSRKVASSPASAFTVRTDWPRDLRSETYIQRLRRVWGKRVAIAVALFVALNAAMIGGSVVMGSVSTPTFPALPAAPARTIHGIAPPEMPLTDAPVLVASVAPMAVADEYLVAVGLFASRDRADQLVDALTGAGLPAMQRALQLRQQELQQIVLGPFLSRSDAVADLRRLQALGGYDDAKVVAGSQ